MTAKIVKADADLFTWIKGKNMGVGEASTLVGNHSLPEIIEVRGNKSTKNFYYCATKKVGQGEDLEIASWLYATIDGAFRLEVFND